MHVEERHRVARNRREISTISQRGRGPSRVNCSVSDGRKPISSVPCGARPTETLPGHFSEPENCEGWQIASGELSVGVERKREVKIGYHILCVVSIADYRRLKSETIFLRMTTEKMPKHIIKFLLGYFM